MVKIEYFETANNLKHNVSGVNFKEIKEDCDTKLTDLKKSKKIHKVKGFKSIEFETANYPDMEITRFDFCNIIKRK